MRDHVFSYLAQVVDAREVYVLMRSEYRVSRNTRASWFFKNLNKVLDFTPVTHKVSVVSTEFCNLFHQTLE